MQPLFCIVLIGIFVTVQKRTQVFIFHVGDSIPPVKAQELSRPYRLLCIACALDSSLPDPTCPWELWVVGTESTMSQTPGAGEKCCSKLI